MKTIKGKLLLWNGILLIATFILLESIVYLTVKQALYNELDSNLYDECMEVSDLFVVENGDITFLDDHEWNEAEHSEVGANAIYFQIVAYPHGAIIKSSNLEELNYTFAITPYEYADIPDQVFITNIEVGNHKFRKLDYPIYENGTMVALLTVASTLDIIENFMNVNLKAFLIITPICLVISLAGMWILSKNSLKPLEQITQTAKRMLASSNLKQPIKVTRADKEVSHLIDTLNELFGKLDKSIEEIKNFSANASHELRTPLTIMRGNIDVILSRERTPDQYRETLQIILEEVKKLSRIVDSMLMLARSDALKEKLQMSVLRLDEVIKQNLPVWKKIAQMEEIELNHSVEPSLEIVGNEEWIQELITNLVENAIKYNHPHGKVFLRAYQKPEQIVLEVEDTGIGIPEEEQDKIFNRFYRIDKNNPRSFGGSGLGLAIVKWIVEEHQGRISLTSKANEGALFRVEFPIVEFEDSSLTKAGEIKNW